MRLVWAIILSLWLMLGYVYVTNKIKIVSEGSITISGTEKTKEVEDMACMTTMTTTKVIIKRTLANYLKHNIHNSINDIVCLLCWIPTLLGLKEKLFKGKDLKENGGRKIGELY